MAEKKSFSESTQRLESLYNGIPDESVDLTFNYLTTPQNDLSEKKKSGAMEPIQERSKPSERLDSLQSSLAMHSASSSPFHHHHHHPTRQSQRKGIPHSNICSLCDSYINFFKNRCMVCGRAYCKNCVRMGMGEMTEGRKCIECLGRRFSQRYIQRAGKFGCCYGQPSEVRRQELIWAEKGASEDKKFNRRRNQAGTPPRRPRFSPGNSPAYIVTASPAFSSSHGLSFDH